MSKNNYNKISPTAKLVAYWRAQCGIPYAKEIAEIADTKKVAKAFFGEKNSAPTSSFITPYIEARYKTINYYLKEEKLNNVLEIAMGLLPRGLEQVSQGNVYVGTDLPDILTESSEILFEIAKKEKIPTQNMHLLPANVMKKEQLEKATEYLKGPIGICNEGLLMYLNREEQAVTAKNIKDILLKHGGVWITPDIDSLDKMKERFDKFPNFEFKTIKEKSFGVLYEKTGRDLLANFFKTEKEAIDFYEKLGFSVELKPFYDVENLNSYKNTPDDMKDYIAQWINGKKTWVLKPKK